MSEPETDLLAIWKTGTFSQVIFQEIQENLRAKEMELIAAETKQLVEKNHQLGGSEHGFYYKSELFVVAGAFGKEGIKLLDPSLEGEAEYLRLNRIEVQQYVTYIAHLLGALDRFCEGNPTRYAVNAPRGLLQFSETLNRLDMLCQTEDGDFYKEARFDPEDKANAAFMAHFNRVDDPINRFLFRRVVY